MIGVLKIELPDGFKKGDCEKCDLGILCRSRYDFDEYHMGCVLDKEDNCPLELSPCDKCKQPGIIRCFSCKKNNYSEFTTESFTVERGINKLKNEKCMGCNYLAWDIHYFPCLDCVDNSNFNCISNYEKFGSCNNCPIDDSDPFQTPVACHKCLEIRGL